LQCFTRYSSDTIELVRITDWDSGVLTFVKRLRTFCETKKVVVDSSGLPQGAQQLLALEAAVPEKKDARKVESQYNRDSRRLLPRREEVFKPEVASSRRTFRREKHVE
jgi:hypothetical protein